MWGSDKRENSAICSALTSLSVTSPTTHKQIGPFWCWFPGGWVCAHSRTLWVSPSNSPLRIGISLAAATPTGFYHQRFWGFISLCWNPGLCGLSSSLIVHPGLSACECRTAPSSSCHLALPHPLHPGCWSLPFLPVWMNVSSLTPWLLDFHTVRLSGSSGYFLFLNSLLLVFWFCEEAKHKYLHLHLGSKWWDKFLISYL